MKNCLSLISLAIIVPFFFAWSANARKDSGDYWKGVMKDEPIPIALEALILSNTPSKPTLVKKPECQHNSQVQDVKGDSIHDFDPRPSLTAYVETTITGSNTEQKPSSKSFEPRPNISSYHDFDPRPSLTGYVETTVTGSNTEQKPLSKSFEPRPNISSYHGGDTVVVVVEKNPHMEDDSMPVFSESFEPRPDATAYGN